MKRLTAHVWDDLRAPREKDGIWSRLSQITCSCSEEARSKSFSPRHTSPVQIRWNGASRPVHSADALPLPSAAGWRTFFGNSAVYFLVFPSRSVKTLVAAHPCYLPRSCSSGEPCSHTDHMDEAPRRSAPASRLVHVASPDGSLLAGRYTCLGPLGRRATKISGPARRHGSRCCKYEATVPRPARSCGSGANAAPCRRGPA